MDKSRHNSAFRKANWSESSVNDPSFAKKKRSGEPLPQHDYFWHRYDWRSSAVQTYAGMQTGLTSSGLESVLDLMYGDSVYNQIGRGTIVKANSISKVHTIVRNKLNKKLYDTPVDLGVALGEYRETANLVTGSMLKAAKLYRDIRHHPFGLAKRALKQLKPSKAAKAAADAWLGYSYAVKPLMSDCFGAAEALQRAYGDADVPLKRVRASHSESTGGSDTYEPLRARSSVELDYRGSGRLYFYVENPLLYTLEQAGVTNPVALGWELVPFSFVVDWFIPVGDWLRGAIVPPQGIKFAQGFTYVKINAKWKRSLDIERPSPGWHTSAEGVEVVKDRKILYDLPRYEMVMPDVSLNRNQLASAAALLTQLLRG